MFNIEMPGGVGFVFSTNGVTPSNSSQLQYETTGIPGDPADGINFNLDQLIEVSYDPGSTNLLLMILYETTQIVGFINTPIDLVKTRWAARSVTSVSPAAPAPAGQSCNSAISVTPFPAPWPATYANGVVLAAGTTSTIDVGDNGGLPVTIGPLSANSGGASTLNIVPAASLSPDVAYTLTMGAVTLNSTVTTFNVANNYAATGTLFLGAVGGGAGLTKGGSGTLGADRAGHLHRQHDDRRGTLCVRADAELGNPAPAAARSPSAATARCNLPPALPWPPAAASRSIQAPPGYWIPRTTPLASLARSRWPVPES